VRNKSKSRTTSKSRPDAPRASSRGISVIVAVEDERQSTASDKAAESDKDAPMMQSVLNKVQEADLSIAADVHSDSTSFWTRWPDSEHLENDDEPKGWLSSDVDTEEVMGIVAAVGPPAVTKASSNEHVSKNNEESKLDVIVISDEDSDDRIAPLVRSSPVVTPGSGGRRSKRACRRSSSPQTPVQESASPSTMELDQTAHA
jgi:hypothetical protein